jgi:ribosomal protein S27AE
MSLPHVTDTIPLTDREVRYLGFATTEADVCPNSCGGFLTARRDRQPGRRCGACGTPEPVASVAVRFRNGIEVRVGLGELRRLLGAA